ncbi:hypothetical protein [Streptomyces sp. NBC_01207]|uniref:hypothetical protein n=1 Tax=Streptomyces sp. NBC_01207 TaxID=2903772 RepID=UPI002E15E873|nr:hypothetical protein OG457_00400 [Streptomyces sp. NBC_01207]
MVLPDNRDPHRLPGGLLLHAAFDGSKWTTLEDPKQDYEGMDAKPLFSHRGAAIASYHGKLHADCPHPMHDDLLHATWTKASGWTKPVRSTPGPAGQVQAARPGPGPGEHGQPFGEQFIPLGDPQGPLLGEQRAGLPHPPHLVHRAHSPVITPPVVGTPPTVNLYLGDRLQAP